MNNNKVIKIKQSNSNVNIKVVPVNEFTKKHSKELFIKLVKSTDSQHDLLQFMDDSTSNYSFSEKPIFLQQIVNKKVTKGNGEPEFGKGSSFRREQKNTKFKTDAPPSYTLTIDKAKAQRKLKTVPQEMNSKSQYLILVRKDQTTFEAHPIENWYKMNPYTKLDISLIEEKEAEYLKRDQRLGTSDKKIREKYKVEETEQQKNEIIYGNEIQELSDSELQEQEALSKRKKNAIFQRIRHGNTEKGESDIDDHQGDEVDYMTDESCDEDQLSEDEKEKLYSAVHVDQEEFLKDGQDLSEESDNEEDKKDEQLKKDENVGDNDDEVDDDGDDSDSDDSDSDDDISDNHIVKENRKTNLNTKPAPTPLKRKNPSDTNNNFDQKRRKTSDPKTDAIVEEMKRNLKQKLLSGKDLFKILLKKKLVENNEECKTLFLKSLDRMKVKTEVHQNIKMYKL